MLCAASAFGQGYDTCTQLKYWEHKSSSYTDTAFYHKQYDSVRLYVELCAARDNESPWAFSYLDNAVQLMSNDTSRYDIYRVWLISVLYLNKTIPEYFCDCLSFVGARCACPFLRLDKIPKRASAACPYGIGNLFYIHFVL
jgi:hypothetical protein